MIEQIALLKGCKVRLEIWLVEDGIKAMMVLKAMKEPRVQPAQKVSKVPQVPTAKMEVKEIKVRKVFLDKVRKAIKA